MPTASPGVFKACQTEKFTTYNYISWVSLDSIIFEMEASYLNDLRGTAFLPLFMRMMGSKIGKNVCMLGICGASRWHVWGWGFTWRCFAQWRGLMRNASSRSVLVQVAPGGPPKPHFTSIPPPPHTHTTPHPI